MHQSNKYQVINNASPIWSLKSYNYICFTFQAKINNILTVQEVQETAGMEASEQKAGVGEEENPWFVDSLEHFRYYFCPECAATKSEN